VKKYTLILLLLPLKLGAQSMDKISHFTTGATISGFTYCVMSNTSYKKAVTYSIVIATAAGIGKEIYDIKKYNSPLKESIKDLGWTTLGASVAAFTLRITF
jgi:hypothetical protein